MRLRDLSGARAVSVHQTIVFWTDGEPWKMIDGFVKW